MAHRLAPPVDWIAAYLKEDRAEADITSQAIFAADHPGVATLHVRSRCFVAGVQVAVSVFERLGAPVTCTSRTAPGPTRARPS